MGLRDEDSTLYRIKVFTKKMLDFCDKVSRNEQVSLEDTEGLSFSEVDEICKKSSEDAKNLVSAL